VTGLLGIYYNLVLPSPFFENFQFVWTGPALTALFAVVIDYSIFRYHLFNAKALVAEFLVFALWIIMAVRGLSAETMADRVGDGAVLLIAIPIGVLLLRAMRLEVKTREVLAAANEQLIELDRMKSEFLSFATHQLRGPLAVIRGYSSELAEGTFGSLGAEAKEAAKRIDESARGLASIIDDYLNVSRLEQGHMNFDMAVADISRLAARDRPFECAVPPVRDRRAGPESRRAHCVRFGHHSEVPHFGAFLLVESGEPQCRESRDDDFFCAMHMASGPTDRPIQPRIRLEQIRLATASLIPREKRVTE
jgi:hypothetical protein